MPVERSRDLRARWIAIASEQRLGGHQDAREAIAALPCLLVQKGLLQRMQPRAVRKAFDGRDLATGHAVEGAGARIGRLAIDQHHARAALLEPAAEAGARETERIAQRGD